MQKSERYRHILATLARHGIEVAAGQFGKEADEKTGLRARHLREACEELGTTFIKLGQMLSSRADLLPAAYREELSKLVDDVPPVPYEEIEGVLVANLGASPELLYESFDRDAFASASIGQAHRARLRDGRDVVVKVQKPAVRETVELDLEIVRDLVKTLPDRFPALADVGVDRLADDFADSLRSELDYEKEAANVAAFREIFEKDTAVAIPEVVPQFSSAGVLTLTRIEGRKTTGMGQISARNAARFSRRIARFCVEPAFEHGIFHADPHAGNILLRDDGSIGVVDFGMVARLTPEARRRVADAFVAVERRDAPRLTDRMLQLTAPARPVDRAALQADIARLLERYVDVSLQDLPLGEAIGALLEIVRIYALRMPGSVAQLFRAMMMCEGILQAIDPRASLGDYLEPVVSQLTFQRIAGDDWKDRIRESAADAAELSMELPRRVDRVLSEIERGNLRVWTRVEDVDTLVTRMERLVERANATMLAAACIVGIAVVMNFYHPQGWQAWIGIVFWIAVAAAVAHVIRTLLALRR